MFYVWLALVVAGQLRPLWRWVQRCRAESWPIATGQIESLTMTESKRSFFSSTPRGSSPKVVVEISYSYSAAGNTETGIYKRDFDTDDEAVEFQRDLKGKPVAVHYNPNNPSNSALLEASVEQLLQTRPPRTSTDYPLSGQKSSLNPLLRQFLWVFIILAFVGLVASVWVHAGAVMGRRVAPEPFFWILHVGIFVVWFPAVFVAKQRVGSLNRRDYWKVLLRDLPDGVRYLLYGFLGYAVVNFLYFVQQASTGGGGNGGDTPAIVWRGFSGHWMVFYFAALAILYSATKENSSEARRVNGHLVPPGANFCTQCGQAAMRR
jgi:Protein of unknown function (DUF3592)